MSTPLTASQVRRAGRTIRLHRRGEAVNTGELEAAIQVIDAYRALHQKPLVTANMGLRSRVRTCGYPVQVTQRLKRFNTIVDKLARHPTMSLPTLQDIGGCRAVLPTVQAIRTVADRYYVDRRRIPVDVNDDVQAAVARVARTVDVVLRPKLDLDRSVIIFYEVMHQWAYTVERLSSRVGENLKQDGSHAIQLLMSAISEAMAFEEGLQDVPEPLQCRIAELRQDAAPYLSARR